jgi:uncharacterized membrane protein YhaH (DUF805 family)
MSNYTYTDFGREVDFAGIFTGLNELSGGWLAGLFLIFLFFIVISINYQRTNDLGASVITSSFIGFIVAVLFWTADMLDLTYVVVFLVFVIISAGARYLANK